MDPSLAAKINDRYIPVKVVDRQREDGDNEPAVQQLMDVTASVHFRPSSSLPRTASRATRWSAIRGRDEFAAFLDRVR